MKLKETLKSDLKVLQSLGKQERLQFIWDYYKIPILAVTTALVLLVMVLTSWVGRKDVAMYAVFVNSDASFSQPQPEMLDDLLVAAGMDMNGKTIDLTAELTLGNNYDSEDGQTLQVLAAMFGISGLDVFAAEQETFDRYATLDAFVDLSLFLKPELYEKAGCTPYRYTNGEGREILGGLILSPGSVLHQAGYYHKDVIIGVAANAQNLEEAVTFVTQLLAELG